MNPTLHTHTLGSLPLLARGKVRDNYAVGDDRILMVASRSCGTLLEPCITKWVLGMRWCMALMRSIAKISPVGSRVNL